MSDALKPEGRSYDDFYRESSSRTSQLLRQEAYGTDIGQHSWITTEELEANISRLKLTGASRLLDLGCGPGGHLTFLLSPVGCHGSGMDLNAQAIAEGRARAASLRIGEFVTFHETDLNASLSFASQQNIRCGDVVGRNSSSSRPSVGVSGSGAGPDSCGKVLIHRCRSHYGLKFR
jgi:SAM-dependent methyltransferase